MHKTKKRILLFLVYLTLLLSFTACDQGGKENDYGSSTEQTTVETAFTEDVHIIMRFNHIAVDALTSTYSVVYLFPPSIIISQV